MLQNTVRLIECPRDAMQGWKHFIPASQKAEYINLLLTIGFDTIDFGSFVSSKAIPQMSDTADVIRRLDLRHTKSKLLAIIANVRGAEEAVAFEEIAYLGFPFSVSETFQRRNANSSMEESLRRAEKIQDICVNSAKQLVVYLSMGFGNPYGDLYSEDIVLYWVNKMAAMGIGFISLADTVGLADPEQIRRMVHCLVDLFPRIEIGVHLHSSPHNWKDKVAAALEAGCLRFDGALKGIGGCPMANDVLVGNVNTEWMISYFEEAGLLPELNKDALQQSLLLAAEIFRS